MSSKSFYTSDVAGRGFEFRANRSIRVKSRNRTKVREKGRSTSIIVAENFYMNANIREKLQRKLLSAAKQENFKGQRAIAAVSKTNEGYAVAVNWSGRTIDPERARSVNVSLTAAFQAAISESAKDKRSERQSKHTRADKVEPASARKRRESTRPPMRDEHAAADVVKQQYLLGHLDA